MPAWSTALAVSFWTCVGLILYSYVAYPILIWTAARLFGRKLVPPPEDRIDWPFASLLIAAHNEEDVIAATIRIALTTDYPADRFEILIGNDGSKDRTADVVRSLDDPRVRLLDYPVNRGKATVLNDSIGQARGSIVLLSDANTEIAPDAARKLVRWFEDPEVGAAVGRLILTDPTTGRNADGLYWKYETFLKKQEARLGALLGANGAIYAIRKDLYRPIPPQTIVDDFVIPLLAKIRSGCRLIYEADATALEETAPEVMDEFHRRARIGAGGFQSIGMLAPLFHPRFGWLTFSFLSHKILRWFCPFFMIGALVSCALLSRQPLYLGLLVVQVLFYLVSWVMTRVPASVKPLRPLRLTTMFTSMNLALLAGFWRWISGRQRGTWRRTSRTAPGVAANPRPE